MECSHLETSVDVSPAFIKELTSENKSAWICSGRNGLTLYWPCPYIRRPYLLCAMLFEEVWPKTVLDSLLVAV